MSYVLNTWRDPFDEGFSICRRKQITIEPGLSILVGCNGCGKTTTLRNIKEEVEKENIPVYHYDNLVKGNSRNTIGAAIFGNNIGLASALMTSSEGESIGINIGQKFQYIRSFIKTGDLEKLGERNPFADLFDDDDSKKEITTNKRFILLDAIDSGYSIDNVIELKNIFNLMLKDAESWNIELYIIVSANEYELANGEKCLDVTTGYYHTFDDYEDYKKFILNSGKKKDNRIKNVELRRQKKEAEENKKENNINKGWKKHRG